MSLTRIEAGFVPLADAAILIAAREMGFAAEEGLDLALVREPSWSNIRDKVALGIYPVAHMLAPMPLAITLGAGALQAEVIAPFLLATNGGAISVSQALRAEMGPVDLFGDPRAAGRALLRRAERAPVRIGAPFPHAMHVEHLRYWIEGCGGDPDRDMILQTVPPPLMAEAAAAGQIDAFCVGEPWGSLAVERGVASLLLPTSAIWGWAPEKALGVRRDWAEAEPETLTRLLRALHRASLWLARPQTLASLAEIMAGPAYLGVAAEVIERPLTGALVVSPEGETRRVPRFLGLSGPETTFPWRSQALWIAARVATRWGVTSAAARAAAAACFRPDLWRAALGPIGADLPGASSKVEGALDSRIAVASSRGETFLGPDLFFDGGRFDPDRPND
jgi:ABC-type nitrate/sulfonate/bicarbonate transport system substrate-binding protein